MEQLSTHYEQGHGLDWLEQAPKDLPEIFHLSSIQESGAVCFAKVFYLEAWAHQQCLCAGRPHTFDVEMEKSC